MHLAAAGGLISSLAIVGTACGTATTSPPASRVVSTSARPSASATPAEDWRQLSVTNPPLARNSAGFAYDATAQNIVLSGGRHGCGPSATAYSDTWTFDGTTWHMSTAQGRGPGDMATFSMAYDPDISKIVALGVYSGCGVATGMMSWDGTSWQPSPQDMTLPSPMFSRSLVYDAAAHELIAFGVGQPACSAGCSAVGGPETWAYNGTSWSQLHPPVSPPGLAGMSTAFDSAINQVVLFGGEPHSVNGTNGAPVSTTWVFDGATWAQLEPAVAPSARDDASMVFDAALGRIVLFGGASSDPDVANASPAVFDDMWSFDGVTWQQLHPATLPSGRFLAQMTYDAATKQIVLFGGALNTTADANDTWTFGVH